MPHNRALPIPRLHNAVRLSRFPRIYFMNAGATNLRLNNRGIDNNSIFR